jgi:hypothetical protein
VRRPSPSYDFAERIGLEWAVNGNPFEQDDEDVNEDGLSPFEEWIQTDFIGRRRCPYCSATLGKAILFGGEEDDWGSEAEGGVAAGVAGLNSEREDFFCQLWRCARCAYWQLAASDCPGRSAADTVNVVAAAISCSFEGTLPEGCRQELAQHLTRNPALWQQISATRLEKLVADIFRANYTNAEVIHVGKPGDLGTDIIFIDSERKKWLVQVKGRSRARAAEGFETLQKLLGTMFLENCQCGIVATTGDHFTYHVYEQAGRAAERGVRVRLLDRGKLARMLGPMIPVDPWRKYVNEIIDWLEKPREYESLQRALLEQLPSMRQLTLFEV